MQMEGVPYVRGCAWGKGEPFRKRKQQFRQTR